MIELTSKSEGLRSLSEIYTPSNLKKIINDGDFSLTKTRITKHIKSTKKLTYSVALKSIYKHLQNNYKSEYLYKNILLNELLDKYSVEDYSILDEFRIGSSLADFVFLNGEIQVYEIKTDLDDLSKLEKQINDYREFANKVYVVASTKHVKNLLERYGDLDIGIVEFDANNRLNLLQKAKLNSKYFNHVTIFKTLRKPEYLELVARYFGFVPDAPNTKIFGECLDLVKTIDVKVFQDLALSILKKRRKANYNFLNSVKIPFELKHLCYTLDLKECEYYTLKSFLNKEL